MKITKKQLVQEIRKVIKEQNKGGYKLVEDVIENMINANKPAHAEANRMLEDVQRFADKNNVPLEVDLENDTYMVYFPNVGWIDSLTAEDMTVEEFEEEFGYIDQN